MNKWLDRPERILARLQGLQAMGVMPDQKLAQYMNRYLVLCEPLFLCSSLRDSLAISRIQFNPRLRVKMDEFCVRLVGEPLANRSVSNLSSGQRIILFCAAICEAPELAQQKLAYDGVLFYDCAHHLADPLKQTLYDTLVPIHFHQLLEIEVDGSLVSSREVPDA